MPGKSRGWRSLAGYNPWGCRVGHNGATSLSLFILSGYISWSGIAGSYGSSISRFLGTSVLFSIVTGSVYILPTVHKTSLFSISFSSFYLLSFLIIAILKAMKCYLIVVFICIYLTFKDVEHLMCLLAM